MKVANIHYYETRKFKVVVRKGLFQEEIEGSVAISMDKDGCIELNHSFYEEENGIGIFGKRGKLEYWIGGILGYKFNKDTAYAKKEFEIHLSQKRYGCKNLNDMGIEIEDFKMTETGSRLYVPLCRPYLKYKGQKWESI